MSTVKMIALGAIMVVVTSLVQNVHAEVPIRPARPDSFKNDAEVKEYMQKLIAFLDKGANRYGKRNTFPLVDLQVIEESSGENAKDLDRLLYKEYPEPSLQHSQRHHYPEWLKQVISRPSKERMWY